MVRRIARVDGRSKAAKRAKELAASFVAQLGKAAADGAAALAAVQKAAELFVVAEELRARALRGETVDLGELVKVEGIADRAVRALGLDRRRELAPTESFADVAARAQAEANVRRARELAEDEAAEDEATEDASESADVEGVVEPVAGLQLTGEAPTGDRGYPDDDEGSVVERPPRS